MTKKKLITNLNLADKLSGLISHWMFIPNNKISYEVFTWNPNGKASSVSSMFEIFTHVCFKFFPF